MPRKALVLSLQPTEKVIKMCKHSRNILTTVQVIRDFKYRKGIPTEKGALFVWGRKPTMAELGVVGMGATGRKIPTWYKEKLLNYYNHFKVKIKTKCCGRWWASEHCSVKSRGGKITFRMLGGGWAEVRGGPTQVWDSVIKVWAGKLYILSGQSYLLSSAREMVFRLDEGEGISTSEDLL